MHQIKNNDKNGNNLISVYPETRSGRTEKDGHAHPAPKAYISGLQAEHVAGTGGTRCERAPYMLRPQAPNPTGIKPCHSVQKPHLSQKLPPGAKYPGKAWGERQKYVTLLSTRAAMPACRP